VRFAYLPFAVAATPAHPGSTVAYRPYIPIRIIGPGGSARLHGLVDTDADQTVLPRAIAEPLGIDIDPEARARFRGVGGHLVTAYYGRVELEVGTRSRRYRWPVTVAFLDSAAGVILGHAGFLHYFTASVNGQHRYVTIAPNNMLPAL
jgi:hypothetical protein